MNLALVCVSKVAYAIFSGGGKKFYTRSSQRIFTLNILLFATIISRFLCIFTKTSIIILCFTTRATCLCCFKKIIFFGGGGGGGGGGGRGESQCAPPICKPDIPLCVIHSDMQYSIHYGIGDTVKALCIEFARSRYACHCLLITKVMTVSISQKAYQHYVDNVHTEQ